MTIPNEIDIDLIEEGDRGRTEYSRVEELSQSIHDNGLIQPVVLVPLEGILVNENGEVVQIPGARKFGLDAGGRRLRALRMLGHKKLYHATTSDPERPGFVLKGEDQATPLKRLFTEIAENLDREDLPWRDEMALLTKAYRLAESDANAQGKHILMRDFGAMLGVGYHDLQAAVIIHDDVVLYPERYKDCPGIRAAYSIKLKHEADELTKIGAIKSIQFAPLKTAIAQVVVQEESVVPAQDEPKREITIPLTSSFFNQDSLLFMKGLPNESFDHIITDPDYGISIERLE